MQERIQQKQLILLHARKGFLQMALMLKTKVSNLPQRKHWNLIFPLLGSSMIPQPSLRSSNTFLLESRALKNLL